MDIDDLKKQWNTMDVPEADVREVERKVASGRRDVMTLRDRLMRISRRQVMVCLAGILCVIPLASEYTVMVLLTVGFLTVMGAMHIVQIRNLRSLDVTHATVTESLRAVLKIETLRTRRHLIGIIMAVPLVVYIILSVTRNYPYILPACLSGLLVGCIVALLINRHCLRLLREIKRELNEDFYAH